MHLRHLEEEKSPKDDGHDDEPEPVESSHDFSDRLKNDANESECPEREGSQVYCKPRPLWSTKMLALSQGAGFNVTKPVYDRSLSLDLINVSLSSDELRDLSPGPELPLQ